MTFVSPNALNRVRAALLASAAALSFVALSFAAPASALDRAGLPLGTGYEVSVPAPAARYPLPVTRHYRNQAGKTADGREVNKYDRRDNPVIEILSGFDRIWTLGDDAWANGGANGDGATDYSHVRIVDPVIWRENIAYVLKVTGENRSPEAALAAYLDDRRNQGYSVIDGFGPFADWYREGAGAVTTVADRGLADFDPNALVTVKEDDKGTEAGSEESALKNFVAFMARLRGPEGTTSPAKYYFASPRPWRMNAEGEVVETGSETVGDRKFETYETVPGIVVPALSYVRETRGRNKDGGFPSGHTNAAYLAAFAYAYAVPERFAELLTRASELGESRIVAGMHSPLDVIGGRIMATAIAAAYLNDPELADLKKAAFDEVQAYFAARLPEGQTLAEAARADADEASAKADRALYRQRLTYGFSRSGAENLPVVVPEGAEVLLETRLPYLTAAQRRAVLFSTAIGSGYPLLDDSQGWGRLDLVAAAAGYGAFNGDVRVTLDVEKGGFHAADRWENAISGPGLFAKSGSGALTLAGDNSYAGGTVLEGGRLVAASATAFGTGPLHLTGGVLEVSSAGLNLGGDLVVDGGDIELAAAGDAAALSVTGTARVNGGRLKLAFAEAPKSGDVLRVIAAGSFEGAFETVEAIGAEGLTLTQLPAADGLSVRVE